MTCRASICGSTPACTRVTRAQIGRPFLDTWAEQLGREIEPGLRAVFLANDAAALATYVRRTEQEPKISRDALSRLEVPVLLVVGERDDERLAWAAFGGSGTAGPT